MVRVGNVSLSLRSKCLLLLFHGRSVAVKYLLGLYVIGKRVVARPKHLALCCCLPRYLNKELDAGVTRATLTCFITTLAFRNRKLKYRNRG